MIPTMNQDAVNIVNNWFKDKVEMKFNDDHKKIKNLSYNFSSEYKNEVKLLAMKKQQLQRDFNHLEVVC